MAGFGTVAGRLGDCWYADERAAGVRYTGALVGSTVVLGALSEAAIDRLAPRFPWLPVVATGVVTWSVLGGRSLEREAMAVHAHLASDDLPGARQRLTHLVSRDTSALSEQQIARAVVESVAENTSDAVVAPLAWGAVAGLPGLVGYRAANTLDAMVGYRNERYLNFGWASARFDDLVNLPGSRLSGLSVLLTSPRQAGAARTAWRRDAHHHPSPNAGVVESTFAAVLGVGLGGRNVYGSGATALVEDRAPMGRGRAPVAADVAAACRLARRVGRCAVVIVAGATAVVGVLGKGGAPT